jgi:hypothetical protein
MIIAEKYLVLYTKDVRKNEEMHENNCLRVRRTNWNFGQCC